MPRREGLPLYNSFAGCNFTYQLGCLQRQIATELHSNSVGINTVYDAILRNDGVYIVGIKNNTRATVNRSAGSEFITNLYVVAILKLLAVWESGVY